MVPRSDFNRDEHIIVSLQAENDQLRTEIRRQKLELDSTLHRLQEVCLEDVFRAVSDAVNGSDKTLSARASHKSLKRRGRKPAAYVNIESMLSRFHESAEKQRVREVGTNRG